MVSFPVNTSPPLGHFEVSLCHKVKQFIKRNYLMNVTVIRLNAEVPSHSTFTKELFSNDGGEGEDNVKKPIVLISKIIALHVQQTFWYIRI